MLFLGIFGHSSKERLKEEVSKEVKKREMIADKLKKDGYSGEDWKNIKEGHENLSRNWIQFISNMKNRWSKNKSSNDISRIRGEKGIYHWELLINNYKYSWLVAGLVYF